MVRNDTIHDILSFIVLLVLIALAGWEHAQSHPMGEAEAAALGLASKHFFDRAANATRSTPPNH